MLNTISSPQINPPTVLRRRGGQPGNRNARKNGAFSRLAPGPLATFNLQFRSLNAALQDPALSSQQVQKKVQKAWQLVDRIEPMTRCATRSQVHAIQLNLRLVKLIARANTPLHLANALSKALHDFAQSPLTWFEQAYRDSGITRDADSFYNVLPGQSRAEKYSFFSVPQKSAFNCESEGRLSRPPATISHVESKRSRRSTCPHRQSRRYESSGSSRQSNYQTHDYPTNVYQTNLTDSQWSVLAPLIPPAEQPGWLTDQPPAIIAANRWKFTHYFHTGDFQDYEILQQYRATMQRLYSDHYPALHDSPIDPPASDLLVSLGIAQPFPAVHHFSPDTGKHDTGSPDTVTRSPGRPPTSPRLLLDAIIWKMATGHTWSELPQNFPDSRLCSKYYRRLYRSGRWYTLILALYNHFRMESSTDLVTLAENDTFVTTRSGKITLHPKVVPTWENCTALLFMQLARSAWSHQQRLKKQAQPLYPTIPLFKGFSPLTTGLPPGIPLPPPAAKPPVRPGSPAWRGSPALRGSAVRRGSPDPAVPPDIDPLEASPVWKKWQELEKNRQLIQRELARLLKIIQPDDRRNLTNSPPDSTTHMS